MRDQLLAGTRTMPSLIRLIDSCVRNTASLGDAQWLPVEETTARRPADFLDFLLAVRISRERCRLHEGGGYSSSEQLISSSLLSFLLHPVHCAARFQGKSLGRFIRNPSIMYSM